MTVSVNLKPSIEQFLSSISERDTREISLDIKTVSAIQERSCSARDDLAHWLHTYKVFMGYSTPLRKDVCKEILQFAWRGDRSTRLIGPNEILREFNALEQRIQSVVPVLQDKPPRVVTSLCSKALWCCYPDDVPISDSNAHSALTALLRIAGIALSTDGDRYSRFLADWFTAYELFLNCVEPKEMQGRFGYVLRSFDRYLWYLGDPTP